MNKLLTILLQGPPIGWPPGNGNPPPPPPLEGPCINCMPLDTGVVLLFIIAIIFAIYALKSKYNKKLNGK